MTADDGVRGQQQRDALALQLVVEREAGIDVHALDDPSVPPPAELAPRQESLGYRVAADEHAGEQLPGRGHDPSLADDDATRGSVVHRCRNPDFGTTDQVPKSGFWL